VIPHELHPFFWDVRADDFDPHQYREYVIGRLLEFGTEPAISWMKATFTEEDIMRVVREDRRLSPKSATFWAFLYGIPREEVTALKLASL
jgi:hypothetical protein